MNQPQTIANTATPPSNKTARRTIFAGGSADGGGSSLMVFIARRAYRTPFMLRRYASSCLSRPSDR